MRQPLSLRSRIVLLFLILDLVLIAAFATSTYIYMRKRLTRSFDAALAANAEALATLVGVNERGALELEFSDEVMKRFSRRKYPDLFAILDRDGNLVEASRSLKKVPEWVGLRKKSEIRDFRTLGENYRSMILPTTADVDGENDTDKPVPVTVFFATTRDDLDDDLEDALEFLLGAAVGMLLISGMAAWIVANRGLKPLHKLSEDAGEIDASSLDQRFDPAPLPSDIQPLATSFNLLLSRLEDAFERERRFSADAAHELRTPVSVLKSGIQAALLSAPDAAKDRESLQELLIDVARLEELCESLLLLSRVSEDGEPDGAMSKTHFAAEVHVIVDSFEAAAAAGGAMITLHAGTTSDGSLRTDAITLRRILTNLVENSLRHGGKNVRIVIDVADTSEGGVVLSVQDSGPGIPESLRQRLFQRFARGDASRARQTGGAGLGLAISRSLAERFGGTLTLEQGADGGARFAWMIASS